MTPQEIADALRESIRAGVFAPGQELIQVQLASRLGTSRIPVREGLRLLAAEGLVVLKQGQGAYVTALNVDELDELYDLRLRLEPPLAPDIIRHLHQRHLDRFSDVVRRMEKCGRAEAATWSSLNFQFHHDMYECAMKQHSFRLIAQLLNLVEPYSRMYVHGLAARGRAETEHRRMIDALGSHDSSGLARAIEDHLEGARNRLLEAMCDQSVQNPAIVLSGID